MVDARASAIARLIQSVQQGVYIGTIGPDATSAVVANPHLRLIFGYASEVNEAEVRPFDADRFVDPHGRRALVERLTAEGAVTNYLVRLRRSDTTTVWVELTGRAEVQSSGHDLLVDLLVRDVSELQESKGRGLPEAMPPSLDMQKIN